TPPAGRPRPSRRNRRSRGTRRPAGRAGIRSPPGPTAPSRRPRSQARTAAPAESGTSRGSAAPRETSRPRRERRSTPGLRPAPARRCPPPAPRRARPGARCARLACATCNHTDGHTECGPDHRQSRVIGATSRRRSACGAAARADLLQEDVNGSVVPAGLPLDHLVPRVEAVDATAGRVHLEAEAEDLVLAPHPVVDVPVGDVQVARLLRGVPVALRTLGAVPAVPGWLPPGHCVCGVVVGASARHTTPAD